MHRRSVLIVVQNLPVPLDRRVWLECQALRAAEFEVAVICPKGPGDPRFEVIDGVSIYKYRPAPATRGLLSYLFEFAYCWLRTAVLSVRVFRRHRFSVLQACNPPDTYWLLGAIWRTFGVKFVFDQHDLNPELFRSRFGDPAGLSGRAQLAVLTWLERMTYRIADHVIVTNGSYREIAMRRGHRQGSDVTVVRSGPDTSKMRPVPGLPGLRKGASHLLVYIGIMGPQDNVDVLLHVMRELVHNIGRRDIHLALLGFGDCLEDLQVLARQLELDDYVTFAGRADQAMIAEYLSTADIGLCPDLKTPLNDVSTHNKTMEYMAFALPVVSFDLAETRLSAGDSAVYVDSGDIVGYGHAVDRLLSDREQRVRMAHLARVRCSSLLDWEPQAQAYVQVFDALVDGARVPAALAPAEDGASDRRAHARGELPLVAGRRVIDLRDPDNFEHFLLTRGLPEAGRLTASIGTTERSVTDGNP